jgi:hemolysin activation/secretion protein
MFSVRGYPESAASGDAGAMGSLEYRLHLPRLLPVESEPPKVFGSPFRFSPENVFGTPDWDFVLSAFLDAGRTVLNDKTPGVEFDETLLSYGVGAELVMLSNLRFQSYYGIAASDLDNGVAESGDDEFHFLFQVSY